MNEGGLSQTARGVIGSDRDGVIFAQLQLRRNKKNEGWRPKIKDPNDESADENEDKKKIESEVEGRAESLGNHNNKRNSALSSPNRKANQTQRARSLQRASLP